VNLLSWSWGVYYRIAILFQVLLPDRVFDVRGAPMLATKADSSSPELVREATSSSVSLVEILTTLLEDTLTLLLDFLLVTVVYCRLSIMSGWTHIISLRSKDRNETFPPLVMRISIDHS